MGPFFSFLREPVKTIQRSRVLNFGTKRTPGDVSIFDRRGAIHMHAGEKSIADAGGGYTPNDPIAIYRPAGGKGIGLQKAMDSNFGWVYACVKAISDEMAGIEFRLFSIAKDGTREEEESHEILDLLDGVNEWQTGPEFKKTMSAHLELTGNAFVFLAAKDGSGVKTYDDKPSSMYLLNPANVRLILNKTIFPYKVSHYLMREDDREFKFEPHQIIHLKYPNPNDPYMGMGTVDGIAEWIDNDNYAMEFNRNFFRNGARLSGVFETELPSVEQAQRLKTSFDEQYAGLKNAWKTLIMPKGVKFTSTQASTKDMDFKALLDMTGERIRAGFRVSNTILGTAESDTNRATAETADYVFAKRTIKPKMELIVSYFNEFLVPRYDDGVYLSFNDPVPEDKQFRTTEMQIAVAGKQVITQNEAREQFMGLGPVDDELADELSTAAPAMPGAPINDAGSKKIKVARKEKKIIARAFVRHSTAKNKSKIKTQFSRNKEMRKGIAEALANSIKKTVEDLRSKKSVVDMTDDEYITAFYVDQKSRMDEFAPKLKEKLADISQKQEREVVKNLSNAIKSYKLTRKKDVDPSKLFDMDEWMTLTVDGLTPLFHEYYGKEAETALRNIGATPFDIFSNEAAKHALDHRINLLARSYNQTILDTLQLKINDGLNEGLSLAELTDRVSDIYAWSEQYQAERVAKTETVAVSNMANKEAWKAAGTVKSVKWYTSEKENVCPFCSAMKGKEIPISENFFDKGDAIKGTDGSEITADYSAIGGPPLHPNCGCFIRPASFSPINTP